MSLENKNFMWQYGYQILNLCHFSSPKNKNIVVKGIKWNTKSLDIL